MWNEQTITAHMLLTQVIQQQKDEESRKAILYSIAGSLLIDALMSVGGTVLHYPRSKSHVMSRELRQELQPRQAQPGGGENLLMRSEWRIVRRKGQKNVPPRFEQVVAVGQGGRAILYVLDHIAQENERKRCLERLEAAGIGDVPEPDIELALGHDLVDDGGRLGQTRLELETVRR